MNKIILYKQSMNKSTLNKAYKETAKHGPLKRKKAMSEKGHTALLLDKDPNCPKYAKRPKKYGQS